MVEGLGIACVIYAAKSSEDRHGSIAGQSEECRAAIRQVPGLRVAGEYADESYSAYKRDRGPQLAAAIAQCEQLAGEDGGGAAVGAASAGRWIALRARSSARSPSAAVLRRGRGSAAAWR